ncbi:B3 domain-containing transcription factor VRN1 [Trifolium repens]|nr:B3 domain-containing transcription factor VRN1 [Trifolium repens]
MLFHNQLEFHRIITQDKNLRIPKKYVEKYWKGISNPIFLRFPNGVEQKIFWKKESNGDVCFEKNWENFAKPLKCGSLLTFKHNGGPYFKVKIFGEEINYFNIKSVEVKEEEDVEGAAKEVIDLSEDEGHDESEDENEDESDYESEDESDYECEIVKKPQRRTRSNQEGMVKTGKKCSTSENPFFEVTLTAYYAHGHFLRVPKKYVEKYWKGISNPIFLIFPNGVEQKVFWKEESNGDVCFEKNWENFAKPLKYGSLLTFKHIGGPYFKVKIFGFNAVEINYSNIKAVEDNEEDVEGAAAKEVIDLSEDEFDDETDDEFEEQPQRRTSKRKVHVESFSNRGGMAKKVKKCSTSEAFNASDIDENPFFEVKMTNCYANGHFMMVPSEFSREHLNNFVGTAFLQVGKNRPMKVNMKFDFSNRRSTISRGWKAFRVCLVREFWRGGEGR